MPYTPINFVKYSRLTYQAMNYIQTQRINCERIRHLAALPDASVSTMGDVVFNTTDKQFYGFDGTKWGLIGGEDLPISDMEPLLKSSTDATKRARFDLSNIYPGNLRIFELPNKDGIIALMSDLPNTAGGFVPSEDNAYDIGSDGRRYKDGHFAGDISVDGTVDGVDISAHKHTGTDGSAKIETTDLAVTGAANGNLLQVSNGHLTFVTPASLTGISGNSGPSGWSGWSGEKGIPGDSGPSGWSGFSGISGYSGRAGTDLTSPTNIFYPTHTDSSNGYYTMSVNDPNDAYLIYETYDAGTYLMYGAVSDVPANPTILPGDYQFSIWFNRSFGSGTVSANVKLLYWTMDPFEVESEIGSYTISSIPQGTSTQKFNITVAYPVTISENRRLAVELYVTVPSTNDVRIESNSGYWFTIITPNYKPGSSGYSGYSGQSGASGISGWSGKSGYSGWSGISGYSGKSGWSGYSGISGYSGPSGYSGISGISGYSGKSGYSGMSGSSGYSGWSGISGAEGPQGISGYSGQNGEQGLSGYSGLSGWSGPSGYSGRSGWSGYSGASGISGWSGMGYSGWSGASGISGASGPRGATGAQGPQGNVGPSGPQGDQGISGYSGWSGAQGATGATGDIGATGDTGPSGFSGYSGFSGFSGAQGASGYSGISGISGYSGISGISGYSGRSGYSGTSGFSGYSGMNGTASASGWSGISGWSGLSGWSGVIGPSGPSGPQGPQGDAGSDGASGISGFSGWSGTSGWSGLNGTAQSGPSGFSGYSGTSGWSGWSGTKGADGGQGGQGASGYSGYSGISGWSGVSGYSGYSGQNAAAANKTATIVLSAQGGLPSKTSGCFSQQVTETSSNKQNYVYLEFDAATQQYAEWNLVLPEGYVAGSTVGVKIYWTADAGTANQTCIWGIAGLCSTDGDNLDTAWGTSVEVSDAYQSAGYTHVIATASSMTLAGTPAGGEIVKIRVYRKAADAGDTLTGNAKLLFVKLTYTTTYSD